jgi:hypothetical protein
MAGERRRCFHLRSQTIENDAAPMLRGITLKKKGNSPCFKRRGSQLAAFYSGGPTVSASALSAVLHSIAGIRTGVGMISLPSLSLEEERRDAEW